MHPSLLTCFSLLFFWSSLLVTDVELPDFSKTLGLATVSNVSCPRVRIGETRGAINSSMYSVGTTETSTASCAADVKMGAARSRVFSDIRLLPSAVSLNRSSDAQCADAVFAKDRCMFNLLLENIRIDPPDPMLHLVMELTRQFVAKESGVYVCAVALPRVVRQLQNHTINPPSPCPPLIEGATPLKDSPLFRAALNIINNVKEVLTIRLAASTFAETTIRLYMNFSKGFHISVYNTTAGQMASSYLPWTMLRSLTETLSLGSMAVNSSSNRLFPSFGVVNGNMDLEVAYPFEMSVDFSFYDFRCGTSGLHCSIPCKSGVELSNIRLKGLREWDGLIVNDVGPWIAEIINNILDSVTERFCHRKDSRFEIPMRDVPHIVNLPPRGLLIGCSVVAFTVTIGMIFFSIVRHRRSPVMMNDGSYISLRRVLFEDTVLILMIVGNVLAFVWSNATTSAVVVVGDEVTLLSFSLIETTRSLYHAGLKPFSFLVFVFSGVYPYIKLGSIFICALVLQRPELTILRVIDYFGKLSFLDSYAMIIMASGLQIYGVAEVNILPGFYVFLVATIFSILTGNYATTLWRRNTSLRQRSTPSVNLNMGDFSDDISLLVLTNENDPTSSERNESSRTPMRCVLYRILHAVMVAGFILPVWVAPCLGYRVNGLASVLQPTDRNMTLYELSSTSTMLLMTCIFTIGIAPFMYAAFYPHCTLLASWGAADALLLACVAGLLQLEQFVEFIIGKEMNVVYTAEAHLLWPLIPLLVSSLWQWVLATEHVFGLSKRAKKYWLARGQAAEIRNGNKSAEERSDM